MTDAQQADTAAATGATNAAAQTAQAAEKPWYDGSEPEFIGTLQTRGLDKKTAVDAAKEFYKAHVEAQKWIGKTTGTTPDRLVIIPKDASDEAGWQALRDKLGVPRDAKEYDFKDVKYGDGKDIDENFREFLRETAGSAKLSKDQAADIARRFVSYIDREAQAEDAAEADMQRAQQEALRKSWGQNYESNKFVAAQAAMKFGLSADMLDALQKVAGYGKVMEGLRAIGQAIGEARYVNGDTSSADGIMTREQAAAKLAEYKRDPLWGKKVLSGDVKATQEFNRLTELMTPRPRDAV